jgi:hypothetical protein
VPIGGFRAGSGRPRGSKDRAPRPPRSVKKRVPEVLPYGTANSADDNDLPNDIKKVDGSLRPVSRAEAEAAAISYLTHVVRDSTASVDRKDRAAISLLSLSRLKPLPPKPKRVRDPIDEALAELKLLR